jgi:N-acetylglucosaminyl-diphospho-decaprenol L-rhamnosyltransferase
MGTRSTVSVLVITWNSCAVLPALLRSLGHGGDGKIELVQVDNASSDDSLRAGRAWEGPLTQITNEQNRGFARALKQAVAAAHGEYLFVVNPDARVDPYSLSVLIDVLDAHPDVGAVGPRVMRSDGRIDPACARHFPTLRGTLAQTFVIHRLLAGTRLDPFGYRRQTYAEEHDVECLSGSAILVRRAALDRAGGVDDRWFMYFEDIDICRRLRGDGWRIRYMPAAIATHEGAASSPRTSPLSVWLAVHLEAGVNVFFRVHRGPGAALVHRALTGVGGVVRMVGGPVVAVRSPEQGRRWFATGRALVLWSLTSRHPAGGPADAVAAGGH